MITTKKGGTVNMSLAIVVIGIIVAVIFQDYFAMVPGLIVGGFDYIRHMSRSQLIMVVIVIIGIMIILRVFKRR